MIELEEKNIITLNLNDVEIGNYIGATARRPFGLILHSNWTLKDVKKLKKEIIKNKEDATKWNDFQNNLEKIGMTKQMKLLIEKSFANEFKDHLQNQKLRELVEYNLGKYEGKRNYEFVAKILRQILQESKK